MNCRSRGLTSQNVIVRDFTKTVVMVLAVNFVISYFYSDDNLYAFIVNLVHRAWKVY